MPTHSFTEAQVLAALLLAAAPPVSRVFSVAAALAWPRCCSSAPSLLVCVDGLHLVAILLREVFKSGRWPRLGLITLVHPAALLADDILEVVWLPVLGHIGGVAALQVVLQSVEEDVCVEDKGVAGGLPLARAL